MPTGGYTGFAFADVGDVDHDGDMDFVGSGFSTGALGFWENVDGKGTVWDLWIVEVAVNGRMVQLASDPDESPVVREVRLQMALLFTDGFESGDTSAWAETVP